MYNSHKRFKLLDDTIQKLRRATVWSFLFGLEKKNLFFNKLYYLCPVLRNNYLSFFQFF